MNEKIKAIACGESVWNDLQCKYGGDAIFVYFFDEDKELIDSVMKHIDIYKERKKRPVIAVYNDFFHKELFINKFEFQVHLKNEEAVKLILYFDMIGCSDDNIFITIGKPYENIFSKFIEHGMSKEIFVLKGLLGL